MNNAPENYDIGSKVRLKKVPVVGNDLVGLLGISSDGTIQNISFDQQIKATKQAGLQKFITSQVIYNLLNQTSNPLYQTNNTQNVGGNIINSGGNIYNNANNATNNTFITNSGQLVNVVQTLAVNPVNGFNGVVTTVGSAASLSIGTPVVGMVKGTGTGIIAATAGVDYIAGSSGGGVSNALTVNSGILQWGGPLVMTTQIDQDGTNHYPIIYTHGTNYFTPFSVHAGINIGGLGGPSLSIDPSGANIGEMWFMSGFGGVFRGQSGASSGYAGTFVQTLSSNFYQSSDIFGIAYTTNGQNLIASSSNFTYDAVFQILTVSKVVVNRSAGGSPLNIVPVAGDPSLPSSVSGDIWYNSTTNLFMVNQNSVITPLLGSSGSWLLASGGALTGNNSIAGAFTVDFANKGISISQSAQSSSWSKTFTITAGAHTAYTAATEFIDIDYASRSVSWLDGTTPTQRFVYFRSQTANKTTSSATFTDIYTQYTEASAAGVGVTFTNNWAAGFAGNVQLIFSGAGKLASKGSQFSIGTGDNQNFVLITNNVQRLLVNGASANSGVWTFSGGPPNGNTTWFTFTQSTSASLSTTGLLWTGAAHTGQAASEAHDWNINLNRTVKFTSNVGFTTQRAFRIQAPTYDFTSATGTITNAYTFHVSGSPAAGANAIITNSFTAGFGGRVQFNQTTTTSPIQIVGFTADPSSPTEGEVSYNTTSHLLKFYNGSSWVSAGGGSGMAIGASVTSGTAGSVLWVDSSNQLAQDNSNFFWNQSSHILSVNTNGDQTGVDSINVYNQIDAYNPNSVQGSIGSGTESGYTVSSSRGTGASPVISNNGDLLGGFSGWGYTGGSPAYLAMGGMWVKASGGTSTNLGGLIDFRTKADNGALTQRLVIDNTGLATFINDVTINGVTNLNNNLVVTVPARSSAWTTIATFAGGADTSRTATAEFIDIDYALNRIVTWNDGTTATQRFVYFRGATVNKTTTSAIFTDIYTQFTDAPTAGTGVTFTNNWAAGFNGSVMVAGNLKFRAGATAQIGTFDNNNLTIFTNSVQRVSISNATTGAWVFSNSVTGSSGFQTWFTFTQSVNAFGVTKGLLWTGAAHTNQSVSGELTDINWNLTRTVQFTSNVGFSLIRAFLISSPTYAFASAGGGVITDSATFAVNGAPIKGTNAAITNTHAILVQSVAVGAATNSFGLTVNVMTGATNNYTAQFVGGKVLFDSSTTTGGFNIKGFTSDPSVSIEGDQAYNTTTHLMKFYNGTSWVSMSGGGGGWSVSGTTTITGTTNQTGSFSNTFNLDSVIITQNALTGAAASSTRAFQINAGAHTAVTAGAPPIDFHINLNRTIQMATGAVTIGYGVYLDSQVYSAVGASVITDAVAIGITSPKASTNITITNSHALYVYSFALNSSTTNSYGVTVNAMTGATNNYSAQFLGGIGVKFAQAAQSATHTFINFTQSIHTGGTPTGLLFTTGAHTTLTSAEIIDINWNLNRTVQFTGSTGFATQRAFLIQAPTYGFVSATGTLTDTATLALTGAPAKGTNASITNTHGLLIQSGAVGTATNSYGLTVNAQTGATNNYTAQFVGGTVRVFSAGTGLLTSFEIFDSSGSSKFKIKDNGSVAIQHNTTSTNLQTLLTLTQGVISGTTGSIIFSVFGGAHTNLTASTENIDVVFQLGRSGSPVQFATGALTTQRSIVFVGPASYSFVGASTITNAITFSVEGMSSAGTNATITNSIALNVAATTVSGAITNTYGLYVTASNGATNNYAAYFTGGLGVKLNHLIGNTSAPTIAAGTGAGTTPTVSITGTDLGGYISVTTGTTPTASGTIVTITFNVAYGAAPTSVVITPANAITAALNGTLMVFVDQAGIATTTFAVTAGSVALVAATAYKWYYQVIQ